MTGVLATTGTPQGGGRRWEGDAARMRQQGDAALDEHEAMETDFFEYTPLVLTPPQPLLGFRRSRGRVITRGVLRIVSALARCVGVCDGLDASSMASPDSCYRARLPCACVHSTLSTTLLRTLLCSASCRFGCACHAARLPSHLRPSLFLEGAELRARRATVTPLMA